MAAASFFQGISCGIAVHAGHPSWCGEQGYSVSSVNLHSMFCFCKKKHAESRGDFPKTEIDSPTFFQFLKNWNPWVSGTEDLPVKDIPSEVTKPPR